MFGGHGQPVGRGPHLTGVFSWRSQEDYLCGRRDHLTSVLDGSLKVFAQLGVAVALVVVTWATFSDHARGTVGIAVGAILLLGLAILLPLLAIGLFSHQRRRDMLQGVLLLGHVRECVGRIERRTTANSGWREVYAVRVAWCLRLPDGQMLEQHSEFDRDDLNGRPLPTPGAPIAVLVRSPSDWMVL